MAEKRRDGLVVRHPNRETRSAKAAKAGVIALLLVSVGLLALVTAGRWRELHGDRALLLAYQVAYLLLAFHAARWTRGVLPVSAGLAIVLLAFAAMAGPEWLRHQPGVHEARLPGLLTLLLVPVEFLLIAVALRAFQQDWHVEVERPADARGRDAEPAAS